MKRPEDIMIRILRDLRPSWPIDSREWIVLGYTINTHSFYLVEDQANIPYDVLEFTFEAVVEVVSKVIWGGQWTKENERAWFRNWHDSINDIYHSGMIEVIDESHLKLLAEHPWISRIE